MNRLFADLPTTIFDLMSGLARELGAVNLGQGFPEADGPMAVREAAARAILDGPNQYPPMRGTLQLREAVAAHYAHWQGVTIDPAREIVVTSGATEALAAALLAALNPGDEVVLFQPMYDSYLPMLRRAGADARIVSLQAPDWRPSRADLAGAFTARTRAVVINTPLNPTASLFDADSLALIAEFCIAHNAVCISDEVWEHVVFDGARHATILNAPGMRDRAIKIGSAGKMFSMTGWKVGFACAAPPLADAFAKAHQYLTFTTPPALQTAVAHGLTLPDKVFDAMRAELQASRDFLRDALAAEGFVTTPAAGTYFIGVDLAASGIGLSDHDFALRAVREAGVASIPYSAFCAAPPEGQFVRLCFAKSPATLSRGVAAMAKARRLFG
jgi:aspartate/methionine/tyrosine aminotransferase